MTIKKCSKCNKEEDFAEKPLCDVCATYVYSYLFIRETLKLLEGLKPIGKVKMIKNKLNNMKKEAMRKNKDGNRT